MRKFLLNLLFAALLIPWVTQAEAQCDNNATTMRQCAKLPLKCKIRMAMVGLEIH